MKKLFCTLMLAVASLTVHAQTTTKYLLGATSCSPWNGTYFCDQIPFTHMDGSQPDPSNGENGNPAFVWSNLLYNGQPNSFYFLTNDGLDAGGFTKNVVTLTDVPTNAIGVNLVTATLKGVGYTGTLQFLYTKGTRHCGGGRAGGCVTPWNIISGTVTVVRP